MTRTILLDGDITAFQFSTMAEKPVHWGDGFWTLHAELEPAVAKMEDHIYSVMERLNADRIVIPLTGDDNFRKRILPTYKENRVKQRRPIILKPMRQYLRENFEVFERPGLEGDDILGILSTSKKIIKGERVIVSIDKDMRTIPGKMINLKRTSDAISRGDISDWEEGIETITEKSADRFHMMQTLAGDQTDGYSGCPGIGMGRAEEIVDNPIRLIPEEFLHTRGKDAGTTSTKWRDGDPCSVWEAIVCQYAKAGLGEEEALRQARVARILRNTDYDFIKKEPKLWLPPKPKK